jgi:hypothetical protein
MLNRWIWLGLLLAACSTTQANSPTELVGFSEPRATDHFDTDEAAWDTFTSPDEQALFWVNDGVLEGAVVANRGYIWSLNNQHYRDVSIQGTVTQTRGSQGNGFGLMCRADKSGDGYYFVISSAGQYAILKGDLDEGADPVPLVKWQTNPAVQRGFEANKLEAICVNDYLALYANDQFLADAHDKTFAAGQLGVVLGAADTTAWVSFDDIIVRDAMLLR